MAEKQSLVRQLFRSLSHSEGHKKEEQKLHVGAGGNR